MGHLRSRRGSQLAQRLKPAPRLQSQAPLRPCPRQGRETPGQTAETLPAADCLMLTTEGIQTKGGGAHQELLHDQRQFSQISYPKHLLIWRGSAMTDTSLSSRANFYIVTKCFHCVTKKVLFPLNMGNRARQQSCETVLLGVKVGERKG